MIRVAILGFWHVHAADYAAEAQARELGVPFQQELGELLARSDVDAVIVTPRTRAHRDVIVAAAAAGKHVFTEKVLALTPTEAREIVAAVERHGVKLTVSLPRLSHGYTLAIRNVLASGCLGEVTQVRCRLSHDEAVGPRWLPRQFFDPDDAGGGALVDLGCHPLYLTRLFLGGMPKSGSAAYGRVTGHAVDDNAVAILRHGTGALGIAETGFVNPCSPFAIEVHGTTGSLLYGTPEPRLLLRDAAAGTDSAWTELPIPASGPTPFEQWVRHVADGTAATENIALALDLTTLVDAADRSALSGTAVTIDAPL